MNKSLKGWNYIVYTLVNNNFKSDTFSLTNLYNFEPYFKAVYPSNFHVKEKLRQILQNLRNKGILEFKSTGRYRLLDDRFDNKITTVKIQQELVYLLSNESIPEWVKIGRTNDIGRRLKELYSTSVPLPFKVEESIQTKTSDESKILEKSIHSIIDTLNPKLRKQTEAYKREFFKMSVNEGKSIFKWVNQIVGINSNRENTLSVE